MSYRFVMQLLIIPLFLSLGKLLINYHNVQFMTTENMIYLLGKPSVWIFILFSLAVLSFLLMFELASSIVLSEYEDIENYLIPFCLDKLRWTMIPKNIIYLPILLLVILGFQFGMNTMITDQLFIPPFIFDTIVKTPSYFTIYIIVIVLAFIIAFHLVFIFHYLFIGQNNFKEAIKNSYSMLVGNRMNFILSAIKIGIKLTLLSAAFYFSLLFLVSFILYLLPPFFNLNGVSLSILFVVNRILVFLVITGVSSVNVLFLTKKYHEYGGLVVDAKNILDTEESQTPKILLFSFMALTLLIQAFGAYQTTMTFEQAGYLEQKTYITSHRANSSVAPENTIAAIKAAKDEKADAAEIDVQLTRDGHVVVIHDYNLRRLAKDPRNVVDLTLVQIKKLEVGSWFSKEFTGEKIPTLEEVIDEAGNEIKLNIELKPSNDEAELAKAVIELLNEKNYNERVIISSLNKQALKEVKNIEETIDVGYIVPVAIERFEFDEEIDFYSLEMSFLSKDLVEKIKNQGKEVHVWTVNSEEDLKKMQGLQVDNVITDYPLLAKKVLTSNVLEKGILEILSILEL